MILETEIIQLLDTPFEKELFQASLKNLKDTDNKLCINNFAYALRALLDNRMTDISPHKKVKKTDWFKTLLKKEDKVSRKDQVRYSIQGDFSNEFMEELDFDIEEITEELYKSYQELSRYTHITEKTFHTLSSRQIKDEGRRLLQLFIKIIEFRRDITSKIEDTINDDIFNEFIKDTLNEVDCLATHHHYEDVEVEELHIQNIEGTKIVFNILGTVYIELQYGSDSDVRNDMGSVEDMDFPFNGEFHRIINSTLQKSEFEKITLSVDNKTFYE